MAFVVELTSIQTAKVKGSSETAELMKPPSLLIHSLWVIDFSMQKGARAKIKPFRIVFSSICSSVKLD